MNSIQEGLTVFGGVKVVLFVPKSSAATSLGIDEDLVLRLPSQGSQSKPMDNDRFRGAGWSILPIEMHLI
jgi:hypothetical protein